jgi:hypothetical protein
MAGYIVRRSSIAVAGWKTACLLISVLFAVNTWAVGHKVTINPATGGSAISADTAGGTWRNLSGPFAGESLPGDIGTGTIILTAPSGFVFNTAAPVSVLVNGSATAADNINGIANNGTISATTTAGGSSVTITVFKASTNSPNTLTWQNIQVRPVAGAPLATGDIAESGTSTLLNPNLTAGTWGILAEVAGVPTHLAFIQQPTSTVLGSAMTPTLVASTVDQFGNVSATSTNQIITLALANNPSGATLTGTTSGNAKNAPVAYANLQVSKAGFGYTLVASAPGFASVTSSSFNVTGTGATTTSLTSSGAAVVGKSVTFTATVTGTGSPSGTVTFKDGPTTLGTAPVSGTHATLITSSLSVGVHSITAVYSGDANFQSSSSTALSQTVTALLAPYVRSGCASGQIQLSWDSQIGVTYQLQAAADLTSGDWSNIGSPLTADSTTATYCDAIDPMCANHFYRVSAVTQ